MKKELIKDSDIREAMKEQIKNNDQVVILNELFNKLTPNILKSANTNEQTLKVPKSSCSPLKTSLVTKRKLHPARSQQKHTRFVPSLYPGYKTAE